MTSKAQFNNALSVLQEKKNDFDKHPEIWAMFEEVRTVFDTAKPWSFLYEIVQNAVDAGAKNILIEVPDDSTLDIQHDGDEPLMEKSVRGLCGFGLSSKGLDSVGFMGVGFKSFTGFFSSVDVSDAGISFLLEAPFRGKMVDIKQLYSPKWVDNPLPHHPEMTTVFRFTEPKGGAIRRFSEVSESINPMDLAVIGSHNLDSLRVGDRQFRIERDGDVVTIVSVQNDDEDDSNRFLVLETEVRLNEEATDEMKTRRRRTVREEDRKVKTVTRAVRLLKPLQVKTDDEDRTTIKPETMKFGNMFCLVSLDLNFPFNIGIDSDWLMNTARTKLRPEEEAGSWHRQLHSALPILIRKYFEWLPVEMRGEDRSASLNIFPDIGEDEVTPGLEFLFHDDFKKIMGEALADCKFILCTDGELRSPNVVSDIPKNSGMSVTTYERLTKECFTCPILDRKAIDQTTIRYLEKLDFLPYPKGDEIIDKEIRSLWDEKDPDDYKHILDILTTITPNEESEDSVDEPRGPAVVPTRKEGVWTNLLGPQIVFVSLPKKSGIEAPLSKALIANYPEVEDTVEVHPLLKTIDLSTVWNGRIYVHKPGAGWRDEAKKSATKIIVKILNLGLPMNEENVLAMFRYCLRNDRPNNIIHLLTNSGCLPKESCVIGAPFSHELMGEIAPNRIISDKATGGFTNINVLNFLKKTGAISFAPSLKSEPMDKDGARDFIGGKEPQRATGNNYSAEDWKWGISLNDITNKEALGRYLSNPGEELEIVLKEAGKDRKSIGRYKKLQFKQQISREQNTRVDCSWITELRETAWVKCADDELRRPNESSIALPGVTPEGKDSLMNEDAVQLYINVGIVFGENIPDDPIAALDYWKTSPASRNSVIFSKTLKKLKKGKQLDSDDLLISVNDALWATTSASAPIRRFIDEPNDDWGGFIGYWGLIDEGIRKTLESIGIEAPNSIHSDIAKEFVAHMVTRDIAEIDDATWRHLREANSIIIKESTDNLGDCNFLRYDDSWSDDNNPAFIQLSIDKYRFMELHSLIIRPEQLPRGIDSLRDLYCSETSAFELIDNQMEVISEPSALNEPEINVWVLMKSLNLPFDFQVTCYDESPLRLRMNNKDQEMDAHYLITDDYDKVHIHLSSDGNYWSDVIANFLIAQDRLHRRQVLTLPRLWP